MTTNHESYLRNALSKYQYSDLAKRDILNAFSSYKDLRPNMSPFVFNDGSRRELLSLDGTIPVPYKGNTYNIPVCLWLLETHPYNPPMVYVKPTSTMQIKPGRHVDANGKVYLPYLHDWRHPQSDLLGLIQILVIIFAEEPPVFSRAQGQPPPPRPAFGPGAGGANTPYPSQGSAQMPVPGYPAAAGSASGYPPSTGYNPTSYPGYYPPQNSAFPAPSGAGYPASTQAATNVSSSIPDDQIKASLRTAVEDKIRRRLKEIFAQSQAEMDALKRTNEDLNKGKHNLDEMVQKLDTEQAEVERNILLLNQKNDEVQEMLRQAENQEELNIDDAVVPTTTLYKQLLNTFAEEQAIEDAIYYLGEALRKEVIDLDIFLKQIRELSRRQFMLRALIHKCRQKAGLPDLTT